MTTMRSLPTRQRRWTRLGAGMGYTNTEPKRAAIRAAIEHMHWVSADDLADVLDTYPVRLFVDGLFYGRRWALCKAAVIAAPEFIDVGPPPGVLPQRRLIGLQSSTATATCCSISATKRSTSSMTPRTTGWSLDRDDHRHAMGRTSYRSDPVLDGPTLDRGRGQRRPPAHRS